MVTSFSGYFGPPFKFQSGMTEGYPLSPNIFNVVVDTVLRRWVSVVKATEGVLEIETEGFG